MKTSRSGQAVAKASFTRLTLMVMRAPILRSFSLMVPQVAAWTSPDLVESHLLFLLAGA